MDQRTPPGGHSCGFGRVNAAFRLQVADGCLGIKCCSDCPHPRCLRDRFLIGAAVASGVLQRPTLVLNRNWQPIHVATVARALVMVYQGTALVVDPEDFSTYSWSDWAQLAPADGESFIQGVSFRLRVPEVITLREFDRVPYSGVPFSRRNLFKRDHNTCQYCGRQFPPDQLTIDHVIPRARGGESTWENCVLACVDCNRRKGNRTPEEAGMRLKRRPTRPKWRPVYAAKEIRIETWTRFVSEAYWNVTLEK